MAAFDRQDSGQGPRANSPQKKKTRKQPSILAITSNLRLASLPGAMRTRIDRIHGQRRELNDYKSTEANPGKCLANIFTESIPRRLFGNPENLGTHVYANR
jgi:hypothetical protein